MPIKGKKSKVKSKSKSSPENDDGCIDDPQSSKLVQRMASKALSSNARKLRGKEDDVDDTPHQAESTSQSSLWLSKAKLSVEDLLDSDDRTFGCLMNGEVRSDIFEHLTLEEVKDLKLVFDAFDADCSGSINVIEIGRILKALGFKISEASLKTITGSFDLDNSGKIDFNDFLDIIISKQGSDRDVHSEIMQGFNLIDCDKTGRISLENLRNVCREHGLKLSDQELRDMIQEADTDGDGEVNASEFVQIMQKTNIF